MRIRCALPLFLMISSFTGWGTDIEKAQQQAVAEHKYILLNFSGSDWCGPCIKMHHDFFETAGFTNYADKYLVLLNADFPRQKKNQLSKDQQKQNNKLADKYNSLGSFPFTVLLNDHGTVLKQWDGYPKMSAGEFIEDIKKTTDAGR
ncbi:MAG: hypothetical protein JWQ30_1944 [Sediminibacterium sp.]|nr:hypothetical protein [Sediminibacterium sp.]